MSRADPLEEIEWVDGLPVVPPTRERVDEALNYTDRPRDEVIDQVPPKFGDATVEKIAINAVMAGCKPEYLPVVITAVKAMGAEEFNLYGILATTHSAWPIIMVNGPVIDELEINYGQNALGQGFRANSTIGRAITLVCMNIGGAIPGQSDYSTAGRPHKTGLCFAENEAENPWEPLHVERGFDPDVSTVTVFGIEALPNINDHESKTAPELLTTCANTMATPGTNLSYHNERGEPHLCLSPEHAEVIANDGWTKMDVKRFLYDQARNTNEERLENYGTEAESGEAKSVDELPWAIHFNVDDPNALVGLASTPEKFTVTVSGGPGGHSVFFPTFGMTESKTVPITLRDGTPIDSVDDYVE